MSLFSRIKQTTKKTIINSLLRYSERMDKGEHWRKNHYTFGTVGRFNSNGSGYFTKEESSKSSNESEVYSSNNESSFSFGDSDVISTNTESSENYNGSKAITLSIKPSFSSSVSTVDDLGYLSLLKPTYHLETLPAQNKTNPSLVDNSILAEFDPYYIPLVDTSSSASPVTCKEILSNVEQLSDLTNEEECDFYEQKLRIMKYVVKKKKIKTFF